MQMLAVARDYLLWHYSAAYADILGIGRNFLWFFHHLFSIPDILKSLFAPFKRLREEPVSFFRHPKVFFANLFVNLLMRLVGFVLRTTIILFALTCFAAVIATTIIFALFWTALPVLVPVIFFSGVLSLFS